MKKPVTQPKQDPPAPRAKYGYSLEHDRVLMLCQTQFGTCPFGCAKDGAPNCFSNVASKRCEPSKQ